MDEVKEDPMNPTVERANKVLMERSSSRTSMSRATFGTSLLLNLLLVAAVVVFAVKWSDDSPCPSAPPPATSDCAASPLLEADYASKFVAWKVQFNKTFANFSAEHKAFAAFAHAEDKINAHNAKNLSYRLGHNEFSHLTAEEFFAHRLGYMPSTHTNYTRNPNRNTHALTIPSSRRALREGRALTESMVDWVAAGAVTPVKNQGSCGGCWSFSATGAMEGMYYIAHNALYSLSEEDLIDCSTGNSGCGGGLPQNAFKWVQWNGIATESDYPYTRQNACEDESCDGTCDTSKTGYTIVASHTAVTPYSKSALLAAVAQQPVSIALDADRDVFQYYSGGVMDSTSCGTSPDHAVLVVGYDTSGSSPYWKIKNSWGSSWGEDGYIRLGMSDDNTYGICGMYSDPSYPNINM